MRIIRKLSYSIASIFAIILCLSFVGCEKVSKSECISVSNDYWYIITNIDGHDYVMGGLFGNSGVGLTHSESCSCKKGK